VCVRGARKSTSEVVVLLCETALHESISDPSAGAVGVSTDGGVLLDTRHRDIARLLLCRKHRVGDLSWDVLAVDVLLSGA